MPTTVRMLFPDRCLERGTGHTVLSTWRHLPGRAVSASLLVGLTTPALARQGIESALPPALRCLPLGRFGRAVRAATERRFLAEIRDDDVAWLWSRVTLDLHERLARRGVRIVREKFSLPLAAHCAAWARAHASLGGPVPPCPIAPEDVEEERRALALADVVASPAPATTAALLDAGVDRARIVERTYGWAPERFPPRPSAPPRGDGLHVLFVGRITAMKGAHLLLRAWAAAGVPGRLVLCGRVGPEIAARCGDLLSRPDVQVLGDRDDVGPVYRGADVFALPSFAEGCPLVVHEATGLGLPCLVTPVAGAGLVRDGEDGFVLPDDDLAPWTDALRTLARDEAHRRALADAARRAGALRTWSRTVPAKRDAVLAALGAAGAPESPRTLVPSPYRLAA